MPFSDVNASCAALRLCVDTAQAGHLSGRVYGQRLTAPLAFGDLGALLLRLDEVLDWQNFPQAFQRPRSFSGKTSGVPAADSPEEGLPSETVNAAQGEITTLCLSITSRRNSSWQGRVDWLDGTAEDTFESALELVGLLEARLER